MTEKITVQSVSDIITSKAGREYFTFGNMEQKRYVCFISKLKEHCKVGSEIEADLTPGKTPDDSPRLDMVYVNGKPVIAVEKKTAGRSYGKSKEELLQIKQLAEAQNRSIQAQTALNRAVDLAVAIINQGAEFTTQALSKIQLNTRQFYQLLQSLTQISEAKVIYKEIKDVPNKVSTKEAGRVSGEGLGQGGEEGGEFDEKWWLKAIKTLDNNEWVVEQLKLCDVTVQKGQLLIKTIKALDKGKQALLKNGVKLALAYKEKTE